MRRANQRTAVFSENGNIALSFGFDFCAEHEWGLRGLNRLFGVSNDVEDATLQRYAITAVPEGALHLVEGEAVTPRWMRGKGQPTQHRRLFLLGGDEGPYRETMEEFVVGYRESYPKPDAIEAHWDEGAFLFSVPVDHKDAERVRKIHAAILAKDALMYCMMSGGPFGGGGLVIARRSTIPTETVSKVEAELGDKKRLREAAEAIGIRERVEAWGRENRKGGIGCAFFALSPRWKPKGHEPTSAYPVIFWLNPYDQQNNNYGWFTCEELEQWMQGEGPIPKAAKKSA